MDKLDEIYFQDLNTSAYMAFYSYKRDIGININDFLVHYKVLYQKLQKFGMTLFNGVLFFFVLNAVNLSEENEKLSRTTCVSLNYATMKETLKKCFLMYPHWKTNVPAVKKEVETIDFHYYRNTKEKKSYGRGDGANLSD